MWVNVFLTNIIWKDPAEKWSDQKNMFFPISGEFHCWPVDGSFSSQLFLIVTQRENPFGSTVVCHYYAAKIIFTTACNYAGRVAVIVFNVGGKHLVVLLSDKPSTLPTVLRDER